MNAAAKRIFDITVSGALLFLFSPMLVVIAVLIKLESPGPVLFRQERLGIGARLFEIFKFRTMVFDTGRNGPSITGAKDSRVTRVGRVLRRFDLDEIPSLFNVLRGDMSLVGPRPEVPKFLPYYTAEQRRVFLVKPGLTDAATLAFRREAVLLPGADLEQTYIREILPRKLVLSLQYIERQDFLHDLGIMLKTVATVLVQRKE